MFDIGWSELLVIAVVAIVVVGPKDLPKLMRSVGHYAGRLRHAASGFQRQFEEAMRESEVAEMKKAIDSMRAETPSFDLKAPIDQPMMLPKQPAPPEEASAKAKPAPARKVATKPRSSGTKSRKAKAERGP